jgi:hypothetical protein
LALIPAAFPVSIDREDERNGGDFQRASIAGQFPAAKAAGKVMMLERIVGSHQGP